jgi:hypothetical protein
MLRAASLPGQFGISVVKTKIKANEEKITEKRNTETPLSIREGPLELNSLVSKSL